MRVRCDNLERRLDLLGGGTTSDVQEVGGLATIQADDVHGGHGQPSSVDHAPDVAVQTNVVEIPLSSLHLPRILLRQIPLLEYVVLPEFGVIVEANLCIGGNEVALGILRQGVDLDHGAIPLDEEIVQGLDLLHGGILVSRHGQTLNDLHGLGIGQALAKVDGNLDDLFGILLGQVLDGRAALRTGDDDGSAAGTVHHNGEVEFAGQTHLLGEEDGVDGLSGGTALLGHESLAQHLTGIVMDLGGWDNVHSALWIHKRWFGGNKRYA